MKALFVTLSLIAVFAPSAYSQSNPRDSGYYARLKTGQVLFTSSLHLRATAAAEKYLLLDNGRTVALSDVDRFYSPLGLFVTVPGSAGTGVYPCDVEGPEISP